MYMILFYIILYIHMIQTVWMGENENTSTKIKTVWAYNLGTPEFIAILKRKRKAKTIGF